MTLTTLAFLIILVTLPVSYGLVKAISFAYEAKDERVHASKESRVTNN